MLPEKGFTTRNVLYVGGLIFALLQLVLPVFVHMIDMQLRALHVLLGISLSFLAYPAGKAPKPRRPSLWDGIVIAVVVAANLNILIKFLNIITIGIGEHICFAEPALCAEIIRSRLREGKRILWTA